MKLEKKHWIIIGIVVTIILIWYFFLRKKKTESAYGFNPPKIIKSPPLRGETAFNVSCPPGWKVVGNRCVPDVATGPLLKKSGASVFCQPPNTLVNGKCVPAATSKTYVYKCTSPGGATTGFSSSSSGNCPRGATEEIIRVIG